MEDETSLLRDSSASLGSTYNSIDWRDNNQSDKTSSRQTDKWSQIGGPVKTTAKASSTPFFLQPAFIRAANLSAMTLMSFGNGM